MGEQMTFPNTWEEYEEFYGFTDSEQVYTNGARLIPSFRVEQWLDHKNVHGEWVNNIHDLPICNKCGYMTPYDRAIDDYEYGNFCPNCGADMKEVEPQLPPLDIRDCDHCKHYVTRDGQTGCEKWECEFEKEE